MATPEDLRMFEAKKGEVKFDPTRDPRGTHAGHFIVNVQWPIIAVVCGS